MLGAGGFIGQHLIHRLATDSQDSVVAFGHFPSYRQSGEGPFSGLPNVQHFIGDLLNRDEVNEALKGVDYVFHLISSTTPAASQADPYIDLETNVRGSVELFDLCTQHGVKKVIFLSSGGTVYGDVGMESISEDTVPKPRSPYGIGKLTIENYLRYFKFTSSLDYVVYRVANPYGPGQNIYGKQGIIPIFMHRFLEQQPVTIYGDGSMVRDYLYIDDLIDMIVTTYALPNKHSEYNLGSGVGESVNEIYDNIADCASYTVDKQYIEASPTFVQKSVLDITRYKNEFGAHTFVSLAEGMKRTWQYVKQLG